MVIMIKDNDVNNNNYECVCVVNLARMTHWADVAPTSICRGPPVLFKSPSQLFLHVYVFVHEQVHVQN